MNQRTSNIPFPSHVDGQALFLAAERLETKLYARLPEITARLSEIDAPVPGYWGEWFRRKMPNVLSYLQVYAYIVGQTLPEKTAAPIGQTRLLDYGAGWGLMGMLAKEVGIGSVVYCDNNQGTARAAKVVSEILDLPFDDIIVGDETLLFNYPRCFDCVVSSDVIEHVYNPDRVFFAVANVCRSGTKVFHQTGANPLNYSQRTSLTRLHMEQEAKLLKERRKVIFLAGGIDDEKADMLASATRGLDQGDLEAAIARFKNDGVVPIPSHPTNTCDLTGYWFERLMDPWDVASKMEAAGFDAEVRQCFWGPGRSGLGTRMVKTSINLLSRLSKSLGLRLSFYYGVAGTKR